MMQANYENALANMERTLHGLTQRLPPPQRVPVLDNFVFRYVERQPEQALVQKLARIVSGLRAAQLLMEAGFVQEQGALQRMLDEFGEDVSFLALGIIYGMTDLHREYLEAFWMEEFDKPGDPVASEQNRPMVKRKKIRAFMARHETYPVDESRGVALGATLSKAFSGYVHGASPHIMEMYGGNPPRFHVAGLRASALYASHRDDLWNYFYRAICAFGMTAKAFGDGPLFETIREYLTEFERTQPKRR
jgi:hypothetical protein